LSAFADYPIGHGAANCTQPACVSEAEKETGVERLIILSDGRRERRLTLIVAQQPIGAPSHDGFFVGGQRHHHHARIIAGDDPVA
jgi:hypothetical protein